jgi:hypothetical protein
MPARKFDSEITIDENDRWIFRGTEITQPEILKYFRNNLKQNQRGVFIENIFGEWSENGFIHAIGYPCHVIAVQCEEDELFFYADDDKHFKFPEFELYQTWDDRIIGIHSESPSIKYRFDWNAAGQLGEFLDEQNGITFMKLGMLQIELPTYEGKIEVPLPVSFD